MSKSEYDAWRHLSRPSNNDHIPKQGESKPKGDSAEIEIGDPNNPETWKLI